MRLPFHSGGGTSLQHTHRRGGAGGFQNQLVTPLLHFESHLLQQGCVRQPLLLHLGDQILVLAVVLGEVADGVHHPLRQNWDGVKESADTRAASGTPVRAEGEGMAGERHRTDSRMLFLRMCYNYASKAERHLQQHGTHVCTRVSRMRWQDVLMSGCRSKGAA